MKFSQQLYPYQEEILSVFEREKSRGEKKIHIVAPPGSGKTIIGLEVMCRLDLPTLILVPNLTLQEQWKDKIEKLFLEEHESSHDLISTDISEVKKINIITYQSLSGTGNEDDEVHNKILDLWYESEKSEFSEKSSFLLFVSELREMNPEEYRELYGKHRKKLKGSGESEYTRKLMKGTIHDYIARLRTHGIATMIVDEAHHLTSWWSHVLYEIWTDLSSPYIIGLTATPPFESVDYFELDESYTKLLGTVDYYIPTPAIVKSGRLAPYSDLLYIVQPDENLSKILSEKEKALSDFLEIHKKEVTLFLHTFLTENFEKMKVKSLDLLEKWMRFIYVHKDSTIDMSSYITANARLPLSLEDIAKSVGKWASDGFKKSKNTELLDTVKSLFFDLGYIWRGSSLYRFETPIEKGLIYSKSKIQAVEIILDQEQKNLGENLRVAIITDFLDVESDWINGHSIFDTLVKKYEKLNPYLVSGQGIWKMENESKILTDETILSVTEKLTRGETRLIIGTRGILGEGWDCPRVNTLIDLTGVSAYMSVNQVHGRAIRLDPDHPDKVANIYDIVCLGTGYPGMRDFERLEKKHTQFYGVDDAGLIIKELDHIYPQLEKVIHDTERINSYTLRKSTLRSMVKELWNIGGEYKNEEVFSLSIEILKPYEVVPVPSNLSFWDTLWIRPENWKNENLLELGKSSYHTLVRMWIKELLDATLQVMKPLDLIPSDFRYDMKWSDIGSITISSISSNPLEGKKFIELINVLFNPITNAKYILIKDDIKFQEAKQKKINFNDSLITFIASLYIIFFIPIAYYSILHNTPYFLFGFLFSPIIIIPLPWIIGKIHIKLINLYRKYNTKKLLTFSGENNGVGIPDIISSNDIKRDLFLGKKYNSITLRKDKIDILKRIFFVSPTKFIQFCEKYKGNIRSRFPSIIGYGIAFIISIFEIILIPFVVVFCILLGTIGIFIFSAYYILYFTPVIIINSIRRRNIIRLQGNIEKVTQEDIGKPSFLSAKIEKLWI